MRLGFSSVLTGFYSQSGSTSKKYFNSSSHTARSTITQTQWLQPEPNLTEKNIIFICDWMIKHSHAIQMYLFLFSTEISYLFYLVQRY